MLTKGFQTPQSDVLLAELPRKLPLTEADVVEMVEEEELGTAMDLVKCTMQLVVIVEKLVKSLFVQLWTSKANQSSPFTVRIVTVP